MRLLLLGTHPAIDFLRPLLERHYELVDAGGSPAALVAFGVGANVPHTVDRVIHVTDDPHGVMPVAKTLVIGATPPTAEVSHARLTTDHPAELLSLIDGFLRYPDRFPVGVTREAAAV